MAIVKQTGTNAYPGQVNTSMGMRDKRAPLCTNCRERKDGQLYTLNPNGQLVCSDCSSPKDHKVLKGTCDPENCPCGQPRDD